MPLPSLPAKMPPPETPAAAFVLSDLDHRLGSPVKILFPDHFHRHLPACPQLEGGSALVEEHIHTVEVFRPSPRPIC